MAQSNYCKRPLTLLLLLLALTSTTVWARDSTQRRTTLRGVSNQLRELGTGNGGGKHTKSEGKSKGGGRSPKSSKPDSEEEDKLPESEEYDDKDDGKGHDGNNKSPKGAPGSDLGGDSEDMSDGKYTKANSGKNSGKNKGGKGKGKEHFHHGA